jgi:hypothetical protein
LQAKPSLGVLETLLLLLLVVLLLLEGLPASVVDTKAYGLLLVGVPACVVVTEACCLVLVKLPASVVLTEVCWLVLVVLPACVVVTDACRLVAVSSGLGQGLGTLMELGSFLRALPRPLFTIGAAAGACKPSKTLPARILASVSGLRVEVGEKGLGPKVTWGKGREQKGVRTLKGSCYVLDMSQFLSIEAVTEGVY